jgi:hypothetical protein
MGTESQSRKGVLARMRQWRECRKQGAAKGRAWVEDRIAQERYRYKGPSTPGG